MVLPSPLFPGSCSTNARTISTASSIVSGASSPSSSIQSLRSHSRFGPSTKLGPEAPSAFRRSSLNPAQTPRSCHTLPLSRRWRSSSNASLRSAIIPLGKPDQSLPIFYDHDIRKLSRCDRHINVYRILILHCLEYILVLDI